MKCFLAYLSTLVIVFAVGVGPSLGQSATSGTCYATTGSGTGNLYTIDLGSGAGTLVGSTGTGGLSGLAVSPTGDLFATSRYVSGDPSLYSINASSGVATLVGITTISGVDGIAFDTTGILYGVDDQPALYAIDPSDASVTWIADMSYWLTGLAVDPTTNDLYGSTGGGFGQEDSVFVIDKATGVETLVGATGLGGATPDLAFDEVGNLYGFKGGGRFGTNNLISISTDTGVGGVIGPVGPSPMSGFTCYYADDDGGGDDPVMVYVDIKPGACPNQLNSNAKNTVNVAILGTADLDVTDIDVSSLMLAGLEPYAWEYIDVSQPPVDEGPCACTSDGADGFVDLQLKFKNQDILATLGDLEDGDEFTLTMEGALNDESEIAGEDCIVIKVPGGKSQKGPGDDAVPVSFELGQNYPNPFNPTTSIEFALPTETYVELGVYNSMGQRVATLVSSTLAAGRHSVQWNATDDSGRSLASGLYIYRIAAGEFVKTQKMLLLE